MKVLPLPLPSLSGRDGALMHFYKLANDGETDAKPAFGPSLVQANLGEQFKDMRQVGRRDADAVISDADDCTISFASQPAASIFPPRSVYLAAFVSRFEKICVRRSKSPSTQSSSAPGSMMSSWPCMSMAVRAASALAGARCLTR